MAGWHHVRDGKPIGPVSTDELATMLARGELHHDSLVWREGLDGWLPAGSLPELRATGRLSPVGHAPVFGLPLSMEERQLLAQRPLPLSALALTWGLTALLLLAVGLLVLMTGGSSETVRVFDLVIAVPALLLGALHAAASVGTWRLSPWGRYLAVAAAALMVLNFPFGILTAARALAYLGADDMDAVFSGRRPEELQERELRALARVHESRRGEAVLAGAVSSMVSLLVLAVLLAVGAALAILLWRS